MALLLGLPALNPNKEALDVSLAWSFPLAHSPLSLRLSPLAISVFPPLSVSPPLSLSNIFDFEHHYYESIVVLRHRLKMALMP